LHLYLWLLGTPKERYHFKGKILGHLSTLKYRSNLSICMLEDRAARQDITEPLATAM